MKFHGDQAELSAFLDELGLHGEWVENGNHNRFNAKTGEIVNFYSTGTVVAQGVNQEAMKGHLEKLCAGKIVAPLAAAKQKNKPHIFVVHGHDRDARDQLELVLRRLQLDPYILQNQDGGGKTLIEALEQKIYEEAAFGIVLVTPDDFGYSKAEGEEARAPRGRQNVILEMGMVMAALGRERMVILKKGEMEMPSDVNGLIYLGFNDRVQDIVPGLVKRLKAAGIEIDDSLVADAAA